MSTLARLTDLRERLGLDDSVDDTLLTRLLHAFTQHAERFCNRQFDRSATATYSGTNVTLTATSHVLHAHTLTLTNNCLLTISAADGASGGVTLKPDSSSSYTVYLGSSIKLLGGGSSFVVTNSASETVNIEWKQTKRGSSDVILANKAVYP